MTTQSPEVFYSYNKTHDLKVYSQYFNMIYMAKKPFELRKNDRDYKEGDTLILRDFDPLRNDYTGAYMVAVVTCVVTGEWLAEGYVALGIRVLR